VVALVLSVAAYFLIAEFQFIVQLVICLITFVSCYLGYNASELGGELVYRHGAANVYTKNPRPPAEEGLLPTPGMDTSESPMPVDENESLKTDDNDYGNSDEIDEVEDEDSKQED
nr:hypothetical protein [Bdellovibrionales bacterium]